MATEEELEKIANDLEIRIRRELGVTFSLIIPPSEAEPPDMTLELSALVQASIVVCGIGVEALMVLIKSMNLGDLTERQACLVMSDIWLDREEDNPPLLEEVVRKAQINAGKLYP